jgi:hypothetical protein
MIIHIRLGAIILLAILAMPDRVQGSSTGQVSNKDQPARDTAVVIGLHEGDSRIADHIVVSGESNPVTVEKAGRITLTARKPIVFLPGTKISAGSFVYASIDPAAKQAKHRKKAARLVTVEEKEKIDEQASLAKACEIFSPFPVSKRGTVHATGDTGRSKYTSSGGDPSAVSPEQQRTFSAVALATTRITIERKTSSFTFFLAASSFRPETVSVLRL